MTVADRSTQIQGLEKARHAMGDSPPFDDQRTTFGKQVENLHKPKLDKNLGAESERKKAFIERKSARLLSLEDSRIWVTTEISQHLARAEQAEERARRVL